jgi:hypothetical protein
VLDDAAMRALMRDLRPTLLIHAAWYVEHGKFWTSPENFPLGGRSLALADAFRDAGGRRIVGLGTGAEYAASRPATASPGPRRGPSILPRPTARPRRSFTPASPPIRASRTAWARIFHVFGPWRASRQAGPRRRAQLMEGREARVGSGRAGPRLRLRPLHRPRARRRLRCPP